MGSTPSVFNSEFLFWREIFQSSEKIQKLVDEFINQKKDLKILLSKNLILLKGCILICFGEKL